MLDKEFEFKTREIDALLQKWEETRIERLSDTSNENKENGKENPEFRKTTKGTSRINIITHNKKKISDYYKIPRIRIRRKEDLHDRK